MKKIIVCLVLMIARLGFLPSEVSALSVQLRGGPGQFVGESKDGSYNFNRVGVDMFIYEGQYIDAFLGVEQGIFSGNANSTYNIPEVKISGKTTGGILGLRLKPPTKWRLKPYLSAGLLIQNVDYDEIKVKFRYSKSFTYPSFTLLSIKKEAMPIGWRGGLGADMEISDRLTLGLEAIITAPSLSEVEISYREFYSATDFSGYDYIELRNLNPITAGINLALRYSF